MHELDRPNQRETYDRIINSKAKWIVINASTGFGKSGLVGQCIEDGHKTLALVAVKSLQSQYEQSYQLSSLTGKANYPCLNAPQQLEILGQIDAPNAETCTLPRSQYKSRCKECCPYPIAREEFISSTGSVTNYTKFLLDGNLIREFDPEYLFLDEAHLLSDVTVDYAGLEFNWRSKEFQKYGEPLYTDKPQPLAFIEVQNWLNGLKYQMIDRKPLEPYKGGNARSWLWYQRRLGNITSTLNFMHDDPASWHIECDRDGLKVRPLTARFNFTQLFDKADKIVLMSATIDRHTLRELGISDYEFISVPNPFPANQRIIQDLQCPGIGWKSSREDLALQAEKISNLLNDCPNDWTGLIHVSSKNMAYDLANRLKTRRNLYIPPREIGTEEVYNEWLSYQSDGTIGLFWQAWEGWDCGKDRINIVAKVPYPQMKFEKVDGKKERVPVGYDTHRFMYDKSASHSSTAAKMVQGWGRIRRGKPDDYGDNKVVAIADGNWKRLRGYISSDIVESII